MKTGTVQILDKYETAIYKAKKGSILKILDYLEKTKDYQAVDRIEEAKRFGCFINRDMHKYLTKEQKEYVYENILKSKNEKELTLVYK